MKKVLISFCLFLSLTSLSTSSFAHYVRAERPIISNESVSAWFRTYDELHLGGMGLKREVFEYALRGLQKTDAKPIISIVDMSQPSSQKRLYVIDLENQKLLFHTYVSHGRNTGELMASSFSNVNSSNKSSLGFYKTLGTYMGKHGLSLKLKGLEKGFNDNAYDRAIVLHGADYVCEDFVRRTGRLGRSQGCPAVPNDISYKIIEAVKGGSCLFVYYPDQDYLKKSTYLATL